MELIAEKRTNFGKSTKSLKKEGRMPAVVYGKGFESISIVLDQAKYVSVYDKSGETDLIDLKLGEETYKILIKNSQFDPVTGKIIHAELYRPNLKEKTEAQVQVEVINEELNPLVKSGEGVILELINEITVEALPADLPHSFIIDASKISAFGEGVTVGQLDYDKSKVEIVDFDDDEFVIRLDKVENKEEEPEAVAEADVIAKLEATGEKKPEDEEGAEGGKGEGGKGGKGEGGKGAKPEGGDKAAGGAKTGGEKKSGGDRK